MARHDHRSTVAPLAKAFAAVEQQAPPDLLGGLAMAGVALFDQDRPDLRLKERCPLWVRRLSAEVHRQGQEQHEGGKGPAPKHDGRSLHAEGGRRAGRAGQRSQFGAFPPGCQPPGPFSREPPASAFASLFLERRTSAERPSALAGGSRLNNSGLHFVSTLIFPLDPTPTLARI